MPSYEGSLFDPPAPVARVVLRNPDSESTVSGVPLLLDTGADVTLLPEASVESLGVSPLVETYYELIGFDGSESVAYVVSMDMIFLGRAFRGRYLLTEEEYGILGRDVLNHVALLLDGPGQEWSERGG